MTSAQFITLTILADALGLADDATDVDILDRIYEMRAEAGDKKADDQDAEVTLIKHREHERVELANGKATVILLQPITFGGETIKALELREPEARDLVRIGDKKNMSANLELIAALAGRTTKELGGLRQRDIKTISAAIRFLSDFGP